jgi:hypothetical protein
MVDLLVDVVIEATLFGASRADEIQKEPFDLLTSLGPCPHHADDVPCGGVDVSHVFLSYRAKMLKVGLLVR